MGRYSFDKCIIRSNTHSVKWGQFANQDIVPLTIADMDFPVAPCILESLLSRVKHGIYGYSQREDLVLKIQKFLIKEYGWDVNSKDIIIVPSIVNALYMMPQLLMSHSGHALIPSSIYSKIFNTFERSNHQISFSKLKLSNCRWSIDYSDLEKQL